MEEIYDELCDMDLPLICAGGIGSEKELNRALELGYDGVQMGTRFIATTECNTPEDYKTAIVDAGEEDITWTNRLTGVPISVIKAPGFKQENSWIMRKLLRSRFKHTARMMLNANSFIRLKYLSKSKSKNTAKGKKFYSAGKSVETVHSIESATIIMRRLGECLNSNPKLV
jgi:nitronate monooxygenase